MRVAAFNTSNDADRRWRIVDYAGETIAESRERFPSIGAAVAHREKGFAEMNVIDRSEPVNWRWPYRRRR
jgi:hypothetical protein